MSAVSPLLLTVRDRLGPARVRGRVVVHQVQVEPRYHGVQLRPLLRVTVGWEQLVCDCLSSHQVVTEQKRWLYEGLVSKPDEDEAEKCFNEVAGVALNS